MNDGLWCPALTGWPSAGRGNNCA